MLDIKTINVEIIDKGGIFQAKFSDVMLGNRYDNNSTELKIITPNYIENDDLKILFNNSLINDVLIDVGLERTFVLPLSLTTEAQGTIGFYFVNKINGTAKNTKTTTVYFAESPKPQGLFIKDLPDTTETAMSQLREDVSKLLPLFDVVDGFRQDFQSLLELPQQMENMATKTELKNVDEKVEAIEILLVGVEQLLAEV